MPIELQPRSDEFLHRHIGPRPHDIQTMLQTLGHDSLESLVEEVIPANIRSKKPLQLDEPLGEAEVLARLREIAAENQVFRSLIGMGYADTIMPAVIQRNILENPAWYTQYTPYQAEISQGRQEALLIFQTMIADLTGFEIANASLLDEATAAAEAMTMFFRLKGKKQGSQFFVSRECHPQTIAVVQGRARPLGIEIMVGDHARFEFSPGVIGALVQYPASDGAVVDYRDFIRRAHEAGALVAVAADLLSLVLLTPPGEFDADAAVGNSQRFGVPMGYGGPHASFFATRKQFVRQVPGRLIGVSRDSQGKPALRMALQTREQHIRREKATSNICTAQALLAILAGMYAVYHGQCGLLRIAEQVHSLARLLAHGLQRLGHRVVHKEFFDTVRIQPQGIDAAEIRRRAESRCLNLRYFDDGSIGIALDERSTPEEVDTLLAIFAAGAAPEFTARDLAAEVDADYSGPLRREWPPLAHPVFNRYHSETEMLRFIRSLEEKDLSLAHSMIPLGSCTMKLNATTEMMPVTWPEFSNLHPFAPVEQARGYQRIFADMERWINAMTGMAATSLQPNAGAQGEYTGMNVIRAYHESRGEGHRNICLIPASAHGTNPASATMAGMQVVVVACAENGDIDVADLRAKAEAHRDRLAALMVTYPSTHGIFEAAIKEICEIVHANGGQVYMDGANLNAQLGWCTPAELGADVCHLNLHKTFAIPHGGGGPGMGPIAVTRHLAPFLPAHPVIPVGGDKGIKPVSAAPWGSPNIVVISWVYIAMMGSAGLKRATEVAILNANYLEARLREHYPILYTGASGRVGHEFIVDLREFKRTAGVDAVDIAKRLMDYSFHAPTVSFPVHGTFMIEPTESESRQELDRFVEAMLAIREEIREIENGKAEAQDNVIKNAPHTLEMVIADAWEHAYAREKAAYPVPGTRQRKFWPAVARIDDAYGDRNLQVLLKVPSGGGDLGVGE